MLDCYETDIGSSSIRETFLRLKKTDNNSFAYSTVYSRRHENCTAPNCDLRDQPTK